MPTRRHFFKTALVAAVGATGLSRISAASEASPQLQQVDKRPLGRIGAQVSIIGLGLGSVFTRPWANNPEGAQALLNLALDHGVNHWDNARDYGPSEEMIGPVVEKRRNEIFLATKSARRDYDGFMREMEISLRTMRTDRVDLMYIHNLRPGSDLGEIENGAMRAIARLKEDKVIGHCGITGHSGAGILIDAIRRFDTDAVLAVFPVTREDGGRYEEELLPLARERNIGVVAMKMVRHARNADLRGSDLIRYAIGLNGVHSAVVGLDTEAHLRENIAMATGFKPIGAEEQASMHRHAIEALAHIPRPWERAGYQDGVPA